MPNPLPALVTYDKFVSRYDALSRKEQEHIIGMYAGARNDNLHEMKRIIKLKYCSGIKIYPAGVTTTFKNDDKNNQTEDIYNYNV